MVYKLLILGGTTQARRFAAQIAERPDLDCTMSLAGRTAAPVAQAVRVRTGGFGGVDGLTRYLRDHKIDLLIDATHPFAAAISANAAQAAAQTGTVLLAIRRPAWRSQPGDRWCEVADLASALDVIDKQGETLGETPGETPGGKRRIFAALGRQELAPLCRAPQHFYLIRSIEPVTPQPALPDAEYILGRGPFALEDEIALLRAHDIDLILAKNSGGAASYAKLAAARELGLAVCLIKRPPLPDVTAVKDVEQAVAQDVAQAVDLLDQMLRDHVLGDHVRSSPVLSGSPAASATVQERGE